MARTFVLGAGASKFAGYPLGPELWAFIRDGGTGEAMSRKTASAVKDAMEPVLKAMFPREPDKPDLELIFTLLDLAEAGVGPLMPSRVDWRGLRPQVMRMIADAFRWHEYRLRDGLGAQDDLAASVLCAWGPHLNEGDTIVTFNWDLLHEAALLRCGKWHYADGYGFACRDAPIGCHSSVMVLKLHGSVNWRQRDEQDCEPEIDNKADFFPGANDDDRVYLKGRGQTNKGRHLIIPSYLKDLTSNRLLLRLWSRAFDALSSTKEMTVIGFQLHPADALARQLIGCALARNPNRFTIQIVSPGTDHWDRFCDRIDRPRRRIRKKFEEWVLGELAVV